MVQVAGKIARMMQKIEPTKYPQCRVPEGLLGVYIREVPPEHLKGTQKWESLADGSTLVIDNVGLEYGEDLDPTKEKWIAAVETKEWSMGADNYYFLTEFDTFDIVCEAVKKHLKNNKKSLYWPDDAILTRKRF